MQIEKVLMVDDDAAIRKVAEVSLSRVGHWDVVLADSGKKAIEIMSEYRPDVILLDVMMPGMDGPTTFKKLRESTGIPIIFMTAKVQREEVQAYYDLGAAGVIMKPFDPLLLPSEIQSVFDKSLNSINSQSTA